MENREYCTTNPRVNSTKEGEKVTRMLLWDQLGLTLIPGPHWCPLCPLPTTR